MQSEIKPHNQAWSSRRIIHEAAKRCFQAALIFSNDAYQAAYAIVLTACAGKPSAPKDLPAAHLSRSTSRGTPQEKEMLQHDIDSTDQAIDALVYQLYDLTEA